jgi:hypothetical protein
MIQYTTTMNEIKVIFQSEGRKMIVFQSIVPLVLMGFGIFKNEEMSPPILHKPMMCKKIHIV